MVERGTLTAKPFSKTVGHKSVVLNKKVLIVYAECAKRTVFVFAFATRLIRRCRVEERSVLLKAFSGVICRFPAGMHRPITSSFRNIISNVLFLIFSMIVYSLPQFVCTIRIYWRNYLFFDL